MVIHIESRLHYDLTRPEEPWHFTCIVGNRSIWTKGVHPTPGFHVYGKDNNSLANGYQGYKRIAQEGLQNHDQPVSSTATAPVIPRSKTAAASEESPRSRDARKALLRAVSGEHICRPGEGDMRWSDSDEFDDMRRSLGEDGLSNRPDKSRLSTIRIF
ncbi:hypothetical protein Daus18300_007981 [Diaporthe australafricana]|uniref:Uncharacterized protein n=1 Tax=Diaporthe australafricana TaxID=127596 RepID=A0ABR3WK68_9PEZI